MSDDTSPRQLFQWEQEISIPIDVLPADTYFLRVKLNGQYETRRVIVQ